MTGLQPDESNHLLFEGAAPAFQQYASSLLRANLRGQPNEDRLVCDQIGGIFIVADGVTRTNFGEHYPEPSPAALASEVFVASVHQALREYLPQYGPDQAPVLGLLEAVTEGNRAVEQLNRELFGGEIDYLGRDFAGTVALTGCLHAGRLYYAGLGDVMGVAIEESGPRLFTNIQTSRVAELRKQPGGWDDQVTVHIRKDIRNNPEHEMKFGVFTGEAKAMRFVEQGRLPLAGVSAVLLFSDGLAGLLKANIDLLRHDSLDAIADEAERLIIDSGKKTDDIAIVRIDVAKYLQQR